MRLRVTFPDVGPGSISMSQYNELLRTMNTPNVQLALHRLLTHVGRDKFAFTAPSGSSPIGDFLTIVDDPEGSEITFALGENLLMSGEMDSYLTHFIPRYSAHIIERDQPDADLP